MGRIQFWQAVRKIAKSVAQIAPVMLISCASARVLQKQILWSFYGVYLNLENVTIGCEIKEHMGTEFLFKLFIIMGFVHWVFYQSLDLMSLEWRKGRMSHLWDKDVKMTNSRWIGNLSQKQFWVLFTPHRFCSFWAPFYTGTICRKAEGVPGYPPRLFDRLSFFLISARVDWKSFLPMLTLGKSVVNLTLGKSQDWHS